MTIVIWTTLKNPDIFLSYVDRIRFSALNKAISHNSSYIFQTDYLTGGNGSFMYQGDCPFVWVVRECIIDILLSILGLF